MSSNILIDKLNKVGYPIDDVKSSRFTDKPELVLDVVTNKLNNMNNIWLHIINPSPGLDVIAALFHDKIEKLILTNMEPNLIDNDVVINNVMKLNHPRLAHNVDYKISDIDWFSDIYSCYNVYADAVILNVPRSINKTTVVGDYSLINMIQSLRSFSYTRLICIVTDHVTRINIPNTKIDTYHIDDKFVVHTIMKY